MERIGSIAKKGTFVEGSHHMHAYADTVQHAHDIRYDGELTPEICRRIEMAWNTSAHARPKHPSGAALRWDGGSRAVDVDVENRKLIVEYTTCLCD